MTPTRRGQGPRRSHRRVRRAVARAGGAAAAVALLVAVPVVASHVAMRTTAATALRPTVTDAPAPAAQRSAPGRPAPPVTAGVASGGASAGAGGRGQTDGYVVPVRRTVLPGSAGVTEPSIIVDRTGALFVTAPSGLLSSPTSPLWKSVDGGMSFSGPSDPPNAGTSDATLGGGDSDLMVDAHNDLFLTSLWLGNTSTAVSTDGGATWTAVPWSHTSPADDRPWFAYDPRGDAMYMVWDGVDGVHVGKALLGPLVAGSPLQGTGGIVFAQDVIAVPESATLPPALADTDIRNCVCSPGGVTVDPNGDIWLAFSRQRSATHGGVGIAESTDGGLTWALSSVPGSGADNAPRSVDNAFITLKSDSDGNLYATWSQADTAQSTQRIYFAVLPHGQTTWRPPVLLPGDADAVMPAMSVIAPGVVDIAYYAAPGYRGYSEAAGRATRWDLELAQSRDALDAATFTTATVDQGIHFGSISVSGITGAVDRSMGDFFSITTLADGNACIASMAQDVTPTGVGVYCQTGPLQQNVAASGASTPAPPLTVPITRGADVSPTSTPPAAGNAATAPSAPPAAAPPAGSDTDLANLPRAAPRILGTSAVASSGLTPAALTSGGLFLFLALAGLLVRGFRPR
jgi:hypothetical protein